MVALLNFLMATLEIVFGRKKLLDGKGPFDDNVFKNPVILLALRMLCKGCKSYFFQFSVFVWAGKTIRISYLWMCYYYDYFENREKCLPFEKIPGYVCTGQRNSYSRTFH